MTRAQCVILMRLDQQPGISQTELAALCEVEPITVARLIDRLEANGMVERRADPSDRRMHRLHLLPAASPVLAEIGQYRTEFAAKLKEGILDSHWETTLRVLLQIKDKVVAEAAEVPVSQVAGEKV